MVSMHIRAMVVGMTLAATPAAAQGPDPVPPPADWSVSCTATRVSDNFNVFLGLFGHAPAVGATIDLELYDTEINNLIFSDDGGVPVSRLGTRLVQTHLQVDDYRQVQFEGTYVSPTSDYTAVLWGWEHEGVTELTLDVARQRRLGGIELYELDMQCTAATAAE
jgi:hypothetical protein